MKKLQKLVTPEELAMTHPQLSHDEHTTQLDLAYKSLEEDYLKVLEKLACSPETWFIHNVYSSEYLCIILYAYF